MTSTPGPRAVHHGGREAEGAPHEGVPGLQVPPPKPETERDQVGDVKRRQFSGRVVAKIGVGETPPRPEIGGPVVAAAIGRSAADDEVQDRRIFDEEHRPQPVQRPAGHRLQVQGQLEGPLRQPGGNLMKPLFLLRH
jgi:hypothetical protein